MNSILLSFFDIGDWTAISSPTNFHNYDGTFTQEQGWVKSLLKECDWSILTYPVFILNSIYVDDLLEKPIN